MTRALLLSGVFMCFAITMHAQESDTTSEKYWKTGGNIGIQLNQAAYSNWQAGGVNSIATNSLLTLFANYKKGDWAWDNLLQLAYGLSFQDTLFNKTDDRIELQSRVDRKLNKNWNMSAMLNFRTQFTNGYANPGETGDENRISTILAPAYTLTGLGLTYKPNDKFNIFISPVTSKWTLVTDQRLANAGAFGVDAAVREGDSATGAIITEGKTSRWEVGGYLNLSYKTNLMENVDLQARLDLYSNYLDGNYEFVDVNGELILFMKVNKYITANLTLNMIYDHDVSFDTNDDGALNGPRTQFKEVLGVGFAYKFGD